MTDSQSEMDVDEEVILGNDVKPEADQHANQSVSNDVR